MQKKQLSKEVSMLNVLSFFFIYRWSWLRVFRRSHVSMLNVLSFFFIETIWHPVMIGDVFRCSIFWAFSLYSLLNISDQYNISVSMLNVLSFFFIVLLVVVRPLTTVFRCSTFWAFSLLASRLMMNADIYVCVSMLNFLSFFFMYRSRNSDVKVRRVSMLNFLSFFFMMH